MLFCPNLFAIPGMCRLCKYCTWIFLNFAESAQQKDLAKFSAKLLSGTSIGLQRQCSLSYCCHIYNGN